MVSKPRHLFPKSLHLSAVSVGMLCSPKFVEAPWMPTPSKYQKSFSWFICVMSGCVIVGFESVC